MCSTQTEQIVSDYQDSIIEMVLLTMGWIQAGALQAFQCNSAEEAKMFAQRLAGASALCFCKRLQVTSGSKVSPAMKRIIRAIDNRQGPCSFAD